MTIGTVVNVIEIVCFSQMLVKKICKVRIDNVNAINAAMTIKYTENINVIITRVRC